MAAKKRGRKKGSWGGRRPGAGRPKGSGKGPSPDARQFRIPVMLREDDVSELYALAENESKPPATVAYELFAESLKKRKRRRKAAGKGAKKKS